MKYDKAEIIGKMVIDFVNAGYKIEFLAPPNHKPATGMYGMYLHITDESKTNDINPWDYIKGENK